MTDIEILRIAAICAVLSIIETQLESNLHIGRKTGTPWTEDHLRISMGLNSLMNRDAGRSPWR